jgi:hypothetical protein
LCGYFATKRIWIHVIDESALAVDLHDREPLAVARLQLGIAVDFDLLQFERDLLADLRDDLACPFAQVASLRVVEDDLRFAWSSHCARRLSNIALDEDACERRRDRVTP